MIITSIHFPSLHFTTLPFTLFHFTSHFTTLHSSFFKYLHFWTFHHHVSKTPHFSSLTITFLTLFLKVCDLQGKVTSTPVGGWFHSLSVLFTKEYLLMSALCFLALILRLRSSLLRMNGPFNLSPIDFHAHSPVYALNRAQKRASYVAPRFPRQNHSHDLQI